MGLFDDLGPNGPLFDFDMDGKLDPVEQSMLSRYEHERLEKLFSNPKPVKDDDWQDFCEDGNNYGLEPWVFDDEEDYEIALELAKLEGATVTDEYEEYEEYDECADEDDGEYEYDEIDEYADEDDGEYEYDEIDEYADEDDVGDEDEYDAYEELTTDGDESDFRSEITLADLINIAFEPLASDKIKREDYPDRRTYEAAYWLAEVEDGFSQADTQTEKRCRFILDNRHILAARYLTYDGDFLYVQALKENFCLPVSFPDNHNSEELIPTSLSDAIEKLIRKNETLSLETWEWCIDNFLPYMEYGWTNNREDLIDDVLEKYLYGSKKAGIAFIEFCQDNSVFWHKLFDNTSYLNAIFSGIGYHCIDSCGNFELLKEMYGYCIDILYDNSDELSDIIDNMYQLCTEDGNIVYIKRYLEEILPLTDHITDERIFEVLKKYRKEVTEYIREEDVFNEKAEETFAEDENRCRFDFAETYTYCGVIFDHSLSIYHYLTEDDTIKIGDEVVVPVGKNNVERTARVVSIG